MMDKTASEAYFQGAHEALESMNVPHHIKVAAAEYLTKEAGVLANIAQAIAGGKGVAPVMNTLPSLGAVRSALANAPGAVGSGALALGKTLGRGAVSKPGLGALALGGAGYASGIRSKEDLMDALESAQESGAEALGLEDPSFLDRVQSGDLSKAEMAALGLGGAGLLGAGAYGASQLM